MNKKVKALVGSALAIAMSVSVATGATFALFTDKAEVSVAITAGKVDVEASLDNVRLYSMGVLQGGTEFENLGYANLDTTNNILTLTNITPGDKVEFDVNLSSLSNVKTKVRTIVEDVSENQELMSGLVIKVNGVETTVANSSATSGWVTADPTAGYNETMTVSIELPADAGNEYQEKSANLRIAIEAVQWNGVTEVASADDLVNAIAEESDVEITSNVALSDQIVLTKDLTVYGNGNVISNSGASKAVFRLDGATEDVNITLENVDLTCEGGAYTRAISVHNNTGDVNIVLKNCDIKAGHYPINIGSGNTGNISITLENCTIEGYGVLNIWSQAEVTLKNCTLTGNNIYSGTTDTFGVIAIYTDASGSVINLIDCKVNANYDYPNTKEYHVLYIDGATGTVNANENTKFFENGTEVSMTSLNGEMG